jgi:hypothetical protein
MKKTFLCSLFALCSLFIFAQEQTKSLKKREIGLTNLDFSGGAFVIKKEIKENTYRRLSLGSANITFDKGQVLKGTDLRLSLDWGREKRKNLVSKLDLIHGMQYGTDFFFINNKNTKENTFEFNNTAVRLNANLGYLIGFIYHLNEKIYIGVETIPDVGLGFTYSKDNDNKTRIAFNSVSLRSSGYFRLTAAYKL